MDFLRNLAINLKATGPAVVVAVWFICITLLGIFGAQNSSAALGIIAGDGVALLTALIASSPRA